MKQEVSGKQATKLLEEILNVLGQIRDQQEMMANRSGSLGRTHEEKVMEHLKKHKTITKQELCRLINVSQTSALNIMKRLNGKSSIRYVAGHGIRPSKLFSIEEGSTEDKALQLAVTMPHASRLSRKEVAEKLKCEEKQVYEVTNSLFRLFPKGEFFWQDGHFIHARD